MYKITFKIAVVTFLLTVSTMSIFGQDRPERLKCQGDVFEYPAPPPRYVMDPSAPEGLMRIDKTETGARRLDLTFHPSAVRVEKIKDEIHFEGIDTSLTWYAIFHHAGPAPPNNGTYLLPVPSGDLPSDTGKFEVLPNPLNYYSFEGSPSEPTYSKPFPDASTIIKLPATLNIKTAGMDVGFYWFTLQAEFGSGDQRCFRTTPPVVIEVTPYIPPPPTPDPKLEITVVASYEACKSATAIATLMLEDLKPENVKITWTVLGPGKTPVSDFYTSPDGKTAIVANDLRMGKYIFTAKASAPGTTAKDASYSAETSFDCRRGAAGIGYFQFEVPYPGEETTLRDPEKWTRDRRKPRRNKNAPYPIEQLPGFYTDAEKPDSMELNNTKRLEEIAAVLRANPDFKLSILGFTDYEASRNYSNDKLGWRRIEAVKDYLVQVLQIDPDRLQTAMVRNCSDKFAYRGSTRWSDRQRWDRRVELFYFSKDDTDPNHAPDRRYIDNCTQK